MTKELLVDWLDKAAACSLPGPGVSRLFLTDEHRKLVEHLEMIMHQCGLATTLDDAGNLVGRAPSPISRKTLYLGSHQDTVPFGGRYDGILGILISLLAMYELKHIELPFSVEVVAFGDEEGARFNSTLLGSTAIAGCFDKQSLSCIDSDGVSLRAALENFGLNPSKIPSIARNKEDALGYVEIHIEQGPVLERDNLPVGLVTAITGIERHTIRISGVSGHAGTVPMHMRQDTLVAAGRYITWLDDYCKRTNDMVGAVGAISNYPNSANVIPGETEITLELRSPVKQKRLTARDHLRRLTSKLRDEGFKIDSKLIYSLDEVECDANLTTLLESSVRKNEIAPRRLFSGAGHDGLAMAHLCPVAMLFVRCCNGISHHPDEEINILDAVKAKNILKQFILDLFLKTNYEKIRE